MNMRAKPRNITNLPIQAAALCAWLAGSATLTAAPYLEFTAPPYEGPVHAKLIGVYPPPRMVGDFNTVQNGYLYNIGFGTIGVYDVRSSITNAPLGVSGLIC